jgi:hypothetical protein
VSINFAARVLLGDTKNDTTELGRFKSKLDCHFNDRTLGNYASKDQFFSKKQFT